MGESAREMARKLEDQQTCLGDIPESCIVVILSLITPKDVARVACVSRVFRDASYSDLVWQSMLPPHYTDILAQAPDAPPCTNSKKEIYDYLSNRVLLQNGTQEFWLDRATGGVCRSIGARGLAIVWGDHRQHWDWRIKKSSRFPEVAYLVSVWWFEIRGQLQCYLPPGTYTLSWRVSMADSEFVHGWNYKPVRFSLETSHGELVHTAYYFSVNNLAHQLGPYWGQDTWIEIDVGEFTVEAGDESVGLTFSMMEIEGLREKDGFSLDCVMIRPTHVKLKDQIETGPCTWTSVWDRIKNIMYYIMTSCETVLTSCERVLISSESSIPRVVPPHGHPFGIGSRASCTL